MNPNYIPDHKTLPQIPISLDTSNEISARQVSQMQNDLGRTAESDSAYYNTLP